MNAIRFDGDVNRPVSLFIKIRPVRFVVVVGLVGIGEMHLSRAKDFEPVVKICAGSKALSTEARAGVVHFEQKDCLVRAIADGRLDMRGVAPGQSQKTGENGQYGQYIEQTHGFKGNRDKIAPLVRAMV